MATTDISDLQRESLPQGKFPVASNESFRVHLAAEVHAGLWSHALQDTSVEICGVLVGKWEKDQHGPYAVVTNYIRSEQAAQKHAEVTFTQDSWTHINKEMDTKYQELRIIGWYHSHPDFGIFLSDRDCFIQEHFFSGPGQIALVVDPVRHLEGIFEWRQGKPAPMHHYWVGNKVMLGEQRPAEQQTPKPDPHAPTATPPQTSPHAAPESGGWDWTGMLLMVMTGFAAFWFGTWWNMTAQNAHYQRVEATLAANFIYGKVLKLGLEQDLIETSRNVDQVARRMADLQQLKPETDQKALQELAVAVQEDLQVVQRHLAIINMRYGQSPEQQALIQELLRRQEQHDNTPSEPGEADIAPPTKSGTETKSRSGSGAASPSGSAPANSEVKAPPAEPQKPAAPATESPAASTPPTPPPADK